METTGIKPGPNIGYILHALLEETLDNPDLNTQDYLNKRAKELALLSESELKKTGESGKEKRQQIEEAEVGEIRKKYHVK